VDRFYRRRPIHANRSPIPVNTLSEKEDINDTQHWGGMTGSGWALSSSLKPKPRERGIAWGAQVASMVLAWRATDGFVRNPPYARSAEDWRSARGGRREDRASP
jgi:hypothetical protein